MLRVTASGSQSRVRVIADLQVHSPYSRATSQNMNLDDLARFARVKGLGIVGTGDFTHPDWRRELARSLEQVQDSGLYRLRESPSVLFMVTGEVNTTYASGQKSRRIHHCLLAPSIESGEAVSDRVSQFGNLSSDGRPTLQVSSAELVDEVIEADSRNVIFPAHAWTPWFSLFGANSGFDTVSECYQDRLGKIFALETGMSSDPPMNWRLSQLDQFCLVSNSDAHSAWPWRLGREANVFDLSEPTYDNVIGAIRGKDPRRFVFTIETFPEYGKYHWTGHRKCGVSMSAIGARRLGDHCPKCGKKMTRGVEERIEELADRPSSYRAKGRPGYRHLLPLSELIAVVIGAENPGSSRVWGLYNPLVEKFGSEYAVMLDAPEEQLVQTAGVGLATAILRVRHDTVCLERGYDGVYGKIDLTKPPVARNDSDGIGVEQYA